MGIFDFLRAKPDPTREWIANPSLTLKLNLDEHSLAGIRIGDPFDTISRLGPTENPKSIQYEVCEYCSKGLRVGFGRGLVDSFEVVFGAATGAEGYSPFVGVCHHRGERVSLGSSTTVAEFIGRFGDPYWRDEDERESLLFYEFGGDIEWQVEFDTQARLQFLQIVTPPLLADAKQRSAYGVDRPWPPSIRE